MIDALEWGVKDNAKKSGNIAVRPSLGVNDLVVKYIVWRREIQRNEASAGARPNGSHQPRTSIFRDTFADS